ncbi:MAG TPA: hypothetical protein VLL95_13875, partial [Phnomibacter sp.]|nr:hypothetical protein [Phnomibacter sp.]
ENAALTETILANQALLNERIAVFDRGITARAKYDLFTENQIHFISRINPDVGGPKIRQLIIRVSV